MAMAMIEYAGIERGHLVLDFGCAKGFLVKAMRLLFRETYGCDWSEYAILNAEPDVSSFVRCSNETSPVPFEQHFDLCISKDVFEHIPHDALLPVLRAIRNKSNQLLGVVPLGDGEQYLIGAYENDKSHIIRENVAWWLEMIKNSGFEIIDYRYHVDGIKDSWFQIHPEGNLVFLAK